jgi:hypothetical protein
MITSTCGWLFPYSSNAGVVADGEHRSYTTLEYKKSAIRLAGMNLESRSESDPGAVFLCLCPRRERSMEGPSMIDWGIRSQLCKAADADARSARLTPSRLPLVRSIPL